MSMTLDTQDVERALVELSTSVLREIADEFVDTAKEHASARSGELRDGISAGDVDLKDSGLFTTTITSSAEHSSWQNEGTGIYGPMGQRIRPTHAKALVFDWPAAGGTVFFTSVAGQEGNHWWDRTILEWFEIVSNAESKVPDAR